MPILPSTLLRLAHGVVVSYGSGIDVEISLERERILAGPHGVAVLEAFRSATTMGAALDQLGKHATGMQDWIELTATVNEFARLGILHSPDAQPAVLSTSAARFDSAHAQVRMLDDATRTSSYLSAIREVVRPGDVVVDMGTGTGILAVAAAQAGAARVYAIEASSIGDSARRVFAANGVDDRVTLVEGLSTRVELPERADVLVSEIIGRDPLEENLLEYTRDAVARFLKPGARMIPSRFEMFALPMSIPDDVRRAWTFTPEGVIDWRREYGVDFSPLVETSRHSVWAMTVTPRRLGQWAASAAAVSVLSRDLHALKEPAFEATARAPVERDGVVDGVALYFKATLSPSITLHNDPRAYRPDSSWDHLFWGLPERMPVAAGDLLEITIRHRIDGPAFELKRRRPGDETNAAGDGK